MMRTEVRTKIIKIIEDITCSQGEVYLNSKFDALGMDSLDIAEAQIAIEEEWNIEISNEEWKKVSFIDQAAVLINEKLGPEPEEPKPEKKPNIEIQVDNAIVEIEKAKNGIRDIERGLVSRTKQWRVLGGIQGALSEALDFLRPIAMEK